jgi:hypothetical protein
MIDVSLLNYSKNGKAVEKHEGWEGARRLEA